MCAAHTVRCRLCISSSRSLTRVQGFIRTLETNTAALSDELRAEVSGERADAARVKGSVDRLAQDSYSQIQVGDYHIRAEERTKHQQDSRDRYEVRRRCQSL